MQISAICTNCCTLVHTYSEIDAIKNLEDREKFKKQILRATRERNRERPRDAETERPRDRQHAPYHAVKWLHKGPVTCVHEILIRGAQVSVFDMFLR